MLWKKAALTALTMMLSAAPCFAFAWEDYVKYRGEPMADALLTSMGQSYMFADLEMSDAGAGRLYCQPAKLKITGAQYRAILDSYVEEFPPSDGQAPVELLLLYGLKYTFPC